MQTTLSTQIPSTPIPSSTPAIATSIPTSRRARWTGRVLSGLPVAFLAFDVAIKLIGIPAVTEASERLGMPVGQARPIALILACSLALYVVRRTAVLGAVLLTGYLGGAVFAHLRIADPLLSHTLFPIYVGALLWGGLYLRDARVRGLFTAR